MRALVVLTGIFLASAAHADAGADFDHSALDAVVQQAVKGRRVDYDAVAKQRKALQAYLARVAKADVKALPSDAARLAFYTNAYNALVLEAVLSSGRPDSVLKVPGFFDKQSYEVAGERLTLNALEETKIRAAKDPRVHFVVNCASNDCPPLARRAYTAKGWASALEQQTKAFLARPGEVAIDDDKKTVTVTKLFDWYQKDWGDEAKVRAFLARSLPKAAAKLQDPSYRIVTREYDWGLNQASAK